MRHRLSFAASLLPSLAAAMSSVPTRPPPRLVTFDIDGTLLKSLGPKGNQAHHHAINNAVNATFGVSPKVVDVNYFGSTDMAIIRDMCLHAGVPDHTINARLPSALADAASRIDAHLSEESDDFAALVLPGVTQVLDALTARAVPIALATGNIEKIAWAKLRAAGIDHYFSTGGFGSDAENRHDIVSTAIARSGSFDVADVVHIGDAKADVQVSSQIGVSAVGVLTGVFTREQLEAEKPLAVLDSLADTNHVLRILGFTR